MMRSLLFVPGDSPRKLQKSLASDADALVFDLEDAVALDEKVEGRKCLVEFLNVNRRNIEKLVFVRINDLSTDWALEDLTAVMPFRPDGIVLPKCRGGHDVQRLSQYLDAFEKVYPGKNGSAGILPVVTESAASLFELSSYKAASTRLWGMLWGAEDLSADIGAIHNRVDGHWTAPFALARSLCLFAAAAAGVVAIDTVPVEIDNDETLRVEAQEAKRDGFAAKAAIHPSQVATINQVFTPTETEQDWARQVIAAFAAGEGVATLNGRMLDRPHLRLAERLLAEPALWHL